MFPKYLGYPKTIKLSAHDNKIQNRRLLAKYFSQKASKMEQYQSIWCSQKVNRLALIFKILLIKVIENRHSKTKLTTINFTNVNFFIVILNSKADPNRLRRSNLIFLKSYLEFLRPFWWLLKWKPVIFAEFSLGIFILCPCLRKDKHRYYEIRKFIIQVRGSRGNP